ncbi:MAG: prepilin-type N-terminal cleavage/methylation domain-containing protein [Candidatus Omnitrophota bacterium]
MRRVFGFTLIELLIVIAVIAILVGITVPRFLGMRDEANSAKASGETAALKAAIEAYRIHRGVFAYDGDPDTWQSQLTAMRPQLIESVLPDPFTAATSPDNEYQLDVSPNGRYYVIWSIGPDAEADISGIDNNGTILTTPAGGCNITTTTCNRTEDIYATNGTP